MLAIICCISSERIAIKANDVVEVLPRVESQPPRDAARRLVGHFMYRGQPTPILSLHDDDSSPRSLSERIVIVRMNHEGDERTVGIAVDSVTTSQLEINDSPCAACHRGRWGRLMHDEHGLLELVEVEDLPR